MIDGTARAVAAPMADLLQSNDSVVTVASGDSLDVRTVRISEGVSSLFRIELTAVSRNQDIDFAEVVGCAASLFISRAGTNRAWDGVVEDVEQTRVEAVGFASYALTIVPKLWLATQRQNYRVFQYLSELDIVQKLLGEHGVRFANQTHLGYKPRKFVMQYGETDFAFISRMLESIGVAYTFEPGDGGLTMMLCDTLESRRSNVEPLPFFDEPPETARRWATKLSVRQRVRPGKRRVQDLDYRKPATAQPVLDAAHGLPQEQPLEIVEWSPGAFLFEAQAGGDTPSADDRGVARTDTGAGSTLVQNRLLADRSTARAVAFTTPAIDLVPGGTLSITGHPHREVEGQPLLVLRAVITGSATGEWRSVLECGATDQPYRPAMVTPKPRIIGVESAAVVGPDAEEIHTDEFARVRVQFHWDREGQRDDKSSCWVPVNQPWGGSGFGAINLPRVGQEVLIEFLAGDPDRPVVMGRVFTKTHPAPYKLPQFKTVSGIRSNTSPRMIGGGSGDDGFAPRAPLPLGSEPMIGGGQDAGTSGSLLGGPGEPFDMSKLTETLQHPFFDASAPDDQTVGWDGNEMSFYDQPGQQQLYMQAQKDLRQVVKDSMTSLVGNSRSAMIGTDDITWVGNRQQTVVGDNQATHVGQHRTVTVGATQSHTVTGDISLDGKANQSYTITEKWDSKAKIQDHTGEEMLVLTVGTSQIVMRPSFIIIQGDDVFINPGAEDTKNAIEMGTRPTPDHEKAAAEAAAHAMRQEAYADKAGRMHQESQDAQLANQEAFANGQPLEQTPLNRAQDNWDAARERWRADPTTENAKEAFRTQTIYDMNNMPGTSTYDGAIGIGQSEYGLSAADSQSVVDSLL